MPTTVVRQYCCNVIYIYFVKHKKQVKHLYFTTWHKSVFQKMPPKIIRVLCTLAKLSQLNKYKALLLANCAKLYSIRVVVASNAKKGEIGK